MPRELSALVVPRHGLLEATGDPFEPYRLVDGGGVAVKPAAATPSARKPPYLQPSPVRWIAQ